VVAGIAGLACETPRENEPGPAERAPSLRPHAKIREEGVPYRTLVEADFAAHAAPRQPAGRDRHTTAYLCGAIAGPPNLDVEITRLDGRSSARVLDPAYRAYLNPRCSWLDPKLDARARRYALAHEQVHFALLEIEARRLNRAIAALEIELPSIEMAAPLAQRDVGELLDRARARYLERSRRFDAEASHPSKQRELDRWHAATVAELEALPAAD